MPQKLFFVSHSADDKNESKFLDLIDMLDGQEEFGPWLDDRMIDTGESIGNRLKIAMVDCVGCIFYLSRNSVKSAYCAAELGAFWGADKPILILREEEGISIGDLAPQLLHLKSTPQIAKIRDAARRCAQESDTRGKESVGRLTRSELGQFVERQLGEALRPISQELSTMRHSLGHVTPFVDSSIFGIRSKHFYAEKRTIARAFLADLGRHYVKGVEESGKSGITLVLDAGTTVYPIFRLLMEQKHDKRWPSAIEITTNNIPGLAVILSEGRIDDSDPRSPLAYRVLAAGGTLNPVYGAMLPADTGDLGRLLGSKSDRLVIGVTTGNYAANDGQTLFVRGPDHRRFKEALIEVSDVIYTLLPLGKMLPRTANELNRDLLSDEGEADQASRYTALVVPAEKDELVIITTRRIRGNKLRKHWDRTYQNLEELQRKHPERVRILVEDFDVDRHSRSDEHREEELEMPHESHRNFLKAWFEWGSPSPS